MHIIWANKGLSCKFLWQDRHGSVLGTDESVSYTHLDVYKRQVPRQLYGIKLMLGAELNILNTKGDIDLDEDYWRMLDIRIAGIFSVAIKA